jgi:hypothetical protein
MESTTCAVTDATGIGLSVSILPMPKGLHAGQKFGDLTIVNRASNDAHSRVRLRCTCDHCGKVTVVRLSDLRSGHTKSCGCRRVLVASWKIGKMQMKRFGNLRVLGKAEAGVESLPSTIWGAGCCFCPKVMFATATRIRAKKVRCKCLDATYVSWRNMKQRCTNRNFGQYSDYGGRGITVCAQWLDDFPQFAKDMKPRPTGTTLDRIDTNGPYSPQNCKWETAAAQAKTRRKPMKKSSVPVKTKVKSVKSSGTKRQLLAQGR